MKLIIDKDKLYCNDISVISSAILEVEFVKDNDEHIKADVTTEIQDYYEINTDNNFNIIDDVVEKFEYTVECANSELSKFIKYDLYDNYKNNSIVCDIMSQLDIFYDNDLKSITIINIKDFSYTVESFEVTE